MIRDRRLKTALATLLAAFATAHLMQFGLNVGRWDAPAEGPSGRAEAAVAQHPSLVRSTGPLSDLPSTPDIAAPVLEARLVVPPSPETTPVPDVGAGLSAYGLPCDRTLALFPAPDASFRIEVTANCEPDSRVVIDHAGLSFTLVTDAFGHAAAVAPALTPDAVIKAVLPDGGTLSARMAVPDASKFDRVAISSDGRSALSIHAFEFGASHGDPGHVHHGAVPGAARGEVRRLGDLSADNALIAEVYTFPTGEGLASGTVRLHVEGEVTAENCARDVAAKVLQGMPGGPPSVVALRVTMPGCDAAGDILVLKNVLRDLRIARN